MTAGGSGTAMHAKPALEARQTGGLNATAATAGPGEAGLSTIARASQRREGEVQSTGPEDADPALTALYERHYSSLVRLAALLVRDIATAEAIVQESFVALARAQRRPANDHALCYLRQGVVYRSRCAFRPGFASNGTAPCAAPGTSASEQYAPIAPEYPAIMSALQMLPVRQREALVLRYYGDLSETQIAPVMGISTSALKRHTERAMASLRVVLESEHDLGHGG